MLIRAGMMFSHDTYGYSRTFKVGFFCFVLHLFKSNIYWKKYPSVCETHFSKLETPFMGYAFPDEIEFATTLSQLIQHYGFYKLLLLMNSWKYYEHD